MISIIIPALNEEQTVGDVVRGVLGAMRNSATEAEVIVVDDGSTDATARQAKVAGARVLKRPHRGKGMAVREGLGEARGETLVLMDSDGQDVPSELPELLKAFRTSRADFVNGSRLAGRILPGGISGIDDAGNRALTLLANVLFGTRLSDINASFRVIRREAIRHIEWRAREFEIESEMILKAVRSGLSIQEVGVTRERRLGGTRKFRKIRHGLRILATILKVRLFWKPPGPTK